MKTNNHTGRKTTNTETLNNKKTDNNLVTKTKKWTDLKTTITAERKQQKHTDRNNRDTDRKQPHKQIGNKNHTEPPPPKKKIGQINSLTKNNSSTAY